MPWEKHHAKGHLQLEFLVGFTVSESSSSWWCSKKLGRRSEWGLTFWSPSSRQRENTGNGVRLRKLQTRPQWHTFPRQATPANLSQTVLPTRIIFKCVRLWGHPHANHHRAQCRTKYIYMLITTAYLNCWETRIKHRRQPQKKIIITEKTKSKVTVDYLSKMVQSGRHYLAYLMY